MECSENRMSINEDTRRTLEERDIETIVHQRRAMFFDMGHRDERALELMSERFRPWLRRKMEAGEYLAWFAIVRDEFVAGGRVVADGLAAAYRWGRKVAREYCECVHGSGIPEAGTWRGS